MKNLTLFFILLLAHVVSAQKTDTLFRASMAEMISLFGRENKVLEVVSASQKQESIEEAPASILVITRQQILERGYQDLSDLLKDLPAVDYTDHAGRFGEMYVVRGVAGNDRFLVLINGKKLNFASGTLFSVGNSVSLRMAERIEVLYSAASIAYGADALSMVINIITEQESHSMNKTQAGLRYGNFNTWDAFLESKIALGHRLSLTVFGRLFSSSGFVFPDSRGFDVVKKYPQPFVNEFSQPIYDHNVYAELKYRNFSVGYFRQHFNEGNARGNLPNLYLYNREMAWIVSTDVAWLNFSKTFNNESQWKTELTYTQNFQDPNSRYDFWSLNPDGTGRTTLYYMTGRDRTLRWFNSYTFQAFDEKINGILGLQFENTYSIPYAANEEVFGNPIKFGGTVEEIIEEKLTIHEQKAAFFGQISYKPLSFLNFTAGFRYDFSKRYEPAFNPRLALILKPLENTIFKLIYSSAFQAPSLYHQFDQFSTIAIQLVSSSKQNFVLKNQRMQSFNFEATQHFGNNIKIGLSAFYNQATDLIERALYISQLPNPKFNNSTPALRYENIGGFYTYGGGLQADYKIHPKIDLNADYSYTDAKQKIGGNENPIHRLSNHKASLQATFRDIKGFTLSTRLRWYSPINPLISSELYKRGGKLRGMLNTYLNLRYTIKKISLFVYSEMMLAGNEQTGLFDGGVYMTTIPQATWIGKVGIEIQAW